MFSDKSTDEQTVDSVLEGNTEDFKEIVGRYQSYIFSIGMRMFRNEDDSLDFVQDVFIKVFNELGSYKKKAPFRSWIIRVAYNYGINILKAKKADVELLEDSASSEPSPESRYARDEMIEILRKAIEYLPEQYRICLDLYFFMGFKYIEIEKMTGYPVNTIKSHVLRAKQMLRDRLRGSIAEDYYEM
jgi:RNA polymerase sigma-70 factor, ECF subfamily